MAAARHAWIVAAGLAALVAGPVSGDTVVLGNGARLSGEVRVGHNTVTVTTAGGELVLPMRRILRVERGAPAAAEAVPEAAEEPAAPAIAEIPPAAPAATTRAPAGRTGAEPVRVRDVLAQRIDVDFEGMAVADVLVYVRELTGLNMALAPEVRADTTPVSLHLKDVRIAEVLNLALEPSGLRYGVRPGEVLYVYAGTGGEMVMRVYPVADLLVSTEDRWGGGNVSLGGGTGNAGGGSLGSGGRNRGGGGGLNPQYAAPQPGAQLQRGGATAAAGTANSVLARRANNLIFLIKNTCGRGTWEDPAAAGVIDAATSR